MQYRQAVLGLYEHLSTMTRICSSDACRDPYDAYGMDENAIRREALVTLRRAILERFPPGRERTA